MPVTDDASAERDRVRMWLEQTVRAQVDNAHRAAAERRGAINHQHGRRGTLNSGPRFLDLLRANDEAAQAATDRTLEQVGEMFRHVNEVALFHDLAREIVSGALMSVVVSAGHAVIEQAKRGGLGGVGLGLLHRIGQASTNLQAQIGGRLLQLRTAEEQRRAGPEGRAAGEVNEQLEQLNERTARVDVNTQLTPATVQDTHRDVRWLADVTSGWYVKQLTAHPWLWTLGNLVAGAVLGAVTSPYFEKLAR